MVKLDSTILSLSNIEVVFSNKTSVHTAVKDVSFNIQRGETLAIVGESGSGKSVTSLAILKLLPSKLATITNGDIKFFSDERSDGVILSELSEKSIIDYRGVKIAMIFQDPMNALNPTQRCGLQVAEMLKIHSTLFDEEIKNMVLKKFSEVDLPEPERIYRSYPHELSGGQLQRVMIAMAIICKPHILIADEPTTALDVTIQKKIIQLLDSLKKETELSTIFITHDLGLVKEIADRVIVMHAGNVVERGSVEQIFNSPYNNYTKGLIACRPTLDRRFYRLPVISDFTDKDIILDDLVLSSDQVANRITSLENSEVLLEVKNVKKYYPKNKSFFGKIKSYTKAVDDVSLKLRKGEILGLVGESGCGKSTLARIIMGLTNLTSGSVEFEGVNLYELSQNALRKLRKKHQIIFQDPYGSLNPRIKIGDAILEPMTIHNIGHNRAEREDMVIDLLEKVGMEADHFHRYPHQFSGGQRQRICIARALSSQPKFILCDESVSALDVSVQAQVLNLLKDLRDELDLSYIFVSHDLSVINFISDRVLVMKSGKIVERGDTASVISDPQHPYTKKLIASVNR